MQAQAHSVCSHTQRWLFLSPFPFFLFLPTGAEGYTYQGYTFYGYTFYGCTYYGLQERRAIEVDNFQLPSMSEALRAAVEHTDTLGELFEQVSKSASQQGGEQVGK